MGEDYRPTLRRMAELADYIKVSDEDLAGLFPGLEEREAVGQLRAWSPRASILLTRGAAGLRLITPEREVVQPAIPVTVIDTVGSGDASMGGWIHSLVTRPAAPLEAHAAFAGATAAVACQHHGAYAPQHGEVAALLAAGTCPAAS